MYEKHGKTKTKLYSIWRHMKERCNNKKHEHYKYYGGRGIKFYEGWNDFVLFLKWAISNGYKDGLLIDRRDNNGSYEPNNCRFVTRLINQNNTSKNKRLTAFGETKTLAEWSRDSRCKVGYGTLQYRISKTSMTLEDAISHPLTFHFIKKSINIG